MKGQDDDTDRELIVIGGPTASGKSSLALALAKQMGTEIISADSRQLYRGMDIGTAKPTHSELKAVPHHFIDCLDVEQSYSAATYELEAEAKIKDIFKRHPTAILVGGTGLYIKAVLEGLDKIPKVEQSIIDGWQKKYQSEGLSSLQKALRDLDPVYYETVDKQNPRRLIRALSVHSATDQPFSSFLNKGRKRLPYQVKTICLAPPRDTLYRRINDRVDFMVQSGLVEEARQYLPQKGLPSLQTVGYQEFFPYFEGAYDLDEAVRLVKRNSRRYAKRQMTWFRNQGNWEMIEEENLEDRLSRVLSPDGLNL